MSDRELLKEIILAKHSSIFLRHSVATPNLTDKFIYTLLKEVIEPLDAARSREQHYEQLVFPV